MTTRVETPQARVRVGLARTDITPPVGIYHRMWGAALHDRATGVHRPLTATALWLEPLDQNPDGRLLVLGLDHCILEAVETRAIRERAAAALGVEVGRVQVSLSHTHGSAWMSRSRAHLPGGDLIGPYLDRLAEMCAALSKQAAEAAQLATFVFGHSRCSLAAHRDFFDVERKHFVCGYNPDGPADDTVLVAMATTPDGKILGTIVNYACHPTTLAWENTLLSPDYVGAMREVVERETGSPCLFLQGASGELGPVEGFVGDPAIADRNGRQLGFAALSGLESLPPAGTRFEYAGPVTSGAVLGTWKHRPLDADAISQQSLISVRNIAVDLAYRPDLPALADTQQELAKWEAEEATARAKNDTARVRDCRAKCEQMTRQITRLKALPAGKTYPFPVTLVRVGNAFWVFTAGELYQSFQTTLRSRFPGNAIFVATQTNDWQPGYLPAASSYGYGIYQEIIAAVGAGSLEVLLETVTRELRMMGG